MNSDLMTIQLKIKLLAGSLLTILAGACAKPLPFREPEKEDLVPVLFSAGCNTKTVLPDAQGESRIARWTVFAFGADGSKASGLFQQLLPLCAERYAFLEMQGEAYESDALGRPQIAWNYGDCRYGLMDSRGRILTSARYREIRALNGDRLLLIGDDRVQLADRNGVVMKTWIIPEGAESSREAAE